MDDDSSDWAAVKKVIKEQNTQHLIFEHEDAATAMQRAEINIGLMKKLLL